MKIQYRVRNTETGLVEHGDFAIRPDGSLWKSGADTAAVTDEFIAEACTGIKDKNKRMIYDGDIVYIAEWECHTYVYFYKGGWMLHFEGCDEYLYEMAEKCEVVGSVHDKNDPLRVAKFGE